jgi:hypothetical protein
MPSMQLSGLLEDQSGIQAIVKDTSATNDVVSSSTDAQSLNLDKKWKVQDRVPDGKELECCLVWLSNSAPQTNRKEQNF